MLIDRRADLCSGQGKVSRGDHLAIPKLTLWVATGLLGLALTAADAPAAGDVAVKRLSDKVNSPSDDYLPWLSLDGLQLGFTSNRPGGLDPLGRAGVFREDLWSSRREPGGPWLSASLWQGPVNTPGSEGSGSLSADGRLLVFSACDRPDGAGDCDLFLAEWSREGWGRPRPLIEVNSPHWDSHPALAPDGSWLLFASDRPGGLGGRDLWLAHRDEDGRFLPPAPAGGALNTPGQEAGPFLHADGRSLYFSSDGRPGLGGLDLFFSRFDGKGGWSPPIHLDPPFNTTEPDLGFCLSLDGRTALFSSRVDGRPDLDLVESPAPPCCLPDPALLVHGRLLQAGTGRPLDGEVKLTPLDGAGHSSYLAFARQGHFTLAPTRKRWLLVAQAPDHLFTTLTLDFRAPGAPTQAGDVAPAPGDTLVLWLEPLLPGAVLALRGVEFAFNRWDLQASSTPALEAMRDWLARHPGFHVELRGHTDDVGSDEWNDELSLRRARSVMDWLEAAGVPVSGIQLHGAGRREPLVQGRDPQSRARNRRTELRWLDP